MLHYQPRKTQNGANELSGFRSEFVTSGEWMNTTEVKPSPEAETSTSPKFGRGLTEGDRVNEAWIPNPVVLPSSRSTRLLRKGKLR